MKQCPTCGRQYSDEVAFCPADGAGLKPVVSSSAPTRVEKAIEVEADAIVGRRIFGDYVIRKKLGEGGMGAVYLAENANIDQRIAIKVLHGEAAQNDELVKRFNREAKAISRLTHPNIIRVFIFGRTEDDLVYLAMEFVEGKPLRNVLAEAGVFEELRAIKVMRQALHALQEAHDMGIVHRDLKPDNIMITHFRGVKEYVKVLDFGIAKVKEPDGSQQKLTQAGVVYGTPEYLSPEQAQAKELDGRSDVYSMGCILYELVTGRVPFQSNTAVAILASHVYDQPKRPAEVAKRSISPEMDRIIMKAMEKDPKDRYQTTMEFLSDLEDLEGKLAGEAVTKTAILDASQMSAILNASKRAEQEKKAAAAPVNIASSTSANTEVINRDGGQVIPPRPAAQQQQPAPPPADKSMQTILIAVVVALGILLLMVIVALVVVLQRQDADASASNLLEDHDPPHELIIGSESSPT